MDLKEVIGSILLAAQEAKLKGDLESAKLLELYRKTEGLSQFSVPAFAISDLEIELHFTIVAGGDQIPAAGEIPDLEVNITATSLKGADPTQLQAMKFRLVPLRMRVLEKSEKD